MELYFADLFPKTGKEIEDGTFKITVKDHKSLLADTIIGFTG